MDDRTEVYDFAETVNSDAFRQALARWNATLDEIAAGMRERGATVDTSVIELD